MVSSAVLHHGNHVRKIVIGSNGFQIANPGFFCFVLGAEDQGIGGTCGSFGLHFGDFGEEC